MHLWCVSVTCHWPPAAVHAPLQAPKHTQLTPQPARSLPLCCLCTLNLNTHTAARAYHTSRRHHLEPRWQRPSRAAGLHRKDAAAAAARVAQLQCSRHIRALQQQLLRLHQQRQRSTAAAVCIACAAPRCCCCCCLPEPAQAAAALLLLLVPWQLHCQHSVHWLVVRVVHFH
jgi:hypothetical protein